MARARNIKPGFYKNEDLAECSVWARLIFPGLWMLADREGRLEDRPKRIKGELLPFDSQDVEPLLRELAHHGFILRYEVDGERFIQIAKFTTHQTPHYTEKKSVIKPPALQEKADDIDRQDSRSCVPMKAADSKKSPPIKRGSLPPDSLNPDSLNPDSLNPDSTNPPADHGRSGEGHAEPLPLAGALSKAMRAKGVESNPMEPRLRALAAAGVTPEQVSAACDVARDAKGQNARIYAAYVCGIVERWLAEPATAPAIAHDPEAVGREAFRRMEAERAAQ